MAIPVFPTPPDPPQRGTDDQSTFSAKADVFTDWMGNDLKPDLETFANDLTDAAAAANYAMASGTSNAIGAGTKTFAGESGKMWSPGQFVIVAEATAPTTNWMFGQVSLYNFATGSITIAVSNASGSGTFAAWLINLSGPQGVGSNTLPSYAGNARKALAVNSGASGTEWVDLGWELIATLSPSGVGTATSAILPVYYADIMIAFNVARSTTSALEVGFSNDNVTWGALPPGASAAAATSRGASRFARYSGDYGEYGFGYNNGAAIGANSGNSGGWACASGIRYLRLVASAGTITGTVPIYGKR